MEKKSIWGAIFLNSALAVALAVYTIVAIVTGTAKKPTNTDVVLALRVNDEYQFESGKLEFQGLDDKMQLVSDNKYVAKKEGEFTCKVTKKNKSKVNYIVTVYGYGDGTSANPYNIAKADHFFDLSESKTEGDTIYDELGATYAIRGDIDLGGINWIPVGNRTGDYEDQIVENADGTFSLKPNSDITRFDFMFQGTILGNGHAIKNMEISITRDNFLQFAKSRYVVDKADNKNVLVDYVYLETGFIGYAFNANITGLTFENASINIAEDILDGSFMPTINGKEVILKTAANNLTGDALLINSTGVVAGLAVRSNIGNQNGEVVVKNSSVVSGSSSSIDGIGLVAGNVRYSTLDNISVLDSKIQANSKLALTGGVIGIVEHNHVANSGVLQFADLVDGESATIITNVNVDNVTVVGNANASSRTAGLVAEVYGATISNVVANGLNVSLTSSGSDTTMVAGGVALLQSFETANGEMQKAMIENVSINATINAIDASKAAHAAAGVVWASSENSLIVNAAFSGEITGNRLAGIVGYNYGNVLYNKDIKVLDAKLNANVSGGGIAIENYGNIKAEGEDGAAVNAVVNVEIKGKNIVTKKQLALNVGLTEDAEFETIVDHYYVGGVAAYSIGEVSGLTVNGKFINSINVGGVVGKLGGTRDTLIKALSKNGTGYSLKQPKTFSGDSKVDSVVSNAVIETIVGTHQGVTNRAAGIVALANSNSTISNVEANGNVNGYAKDEAVSGNKVAGLVADMNGSAISLTNAKSSMSIKVNNSGYYLGLDVSPEYSAYVAGAVAFINQTAGTPITIDGVEVVSSGVVGSIQNNLGDYNNNNGKFDTAASGAYGLVGIVNGNGVTVVLKNMKISGFEVIAHNNASSAFGIIKNAKIENVVTDVAKVAGRLVGGMFASAHNVEVSKSGCTIGELNLIEADMDQRIAGFVADIKNKFTATDCYTIVGNEIAVGATDSTIKVAGFAIQDANGNTLDCTYTNIVVYVNAHRGTSGVVPITSVNGSSSSANTNVKVLNDTSSEVLDGVQLLTAEQMKDKANFSGFDFTNIWGLKDGALCPTFDREVVEENPEVAA